jgi:hypothetical protein
MFPASNQLFSPYGATTNTTTSFQRDQLLLGLRNVKPNKSTFIKTWKPDEITEMN